MVVLRDGTIAVSTNLSSWQRISAVPGMFQDTRVQEVELTNQRSFTVLTSNGRAFQSADAKNWSELTVQTPSVNRD